MWMIYSIMVFYDFIKINHDQAANSCLVYLLSPTARLESEISIFVSDSGNWTLSRLRRAFLLIPATSPNGVGGRKAQRVRIPMLLPTILCLVWPICSSMSMMWPATYLSKKDWPTTVMGIYARWAAQRTVLGQMRSDIFIRAINSQRCTMVR